MKKFFMIFIGLSIISNCFAQANLNDFLKQERSKLKNAAFCECMVRATSNGMQVFKNDGSAAGYFELGFHSIEAYEKVGAYTHKYLKRTETNYKSKGEHTLAMMRCLDFYNSPELGRYIMSLDSEIDVTKISQEGDLNEDSLMADFKHVQAWGLFSNATAQVQDSVRRDSLLLESTRIWKEAIRLNQKVPQYFINAAFAFRILGRYDSSIKMLENLLQVESNHPEALLMIGTIKEKTGKLEEANAYYRDAVTSYKEYLKRFDVTIKDEMNSQFAMLLLEGKEKALDRIKKERKLNSDVSTYSLIEDIIIDFDRKEYFEDL